MEFTYTVIFEPAEEGGYIAQVPALDDATTQGETLEEARLWAKDLIEGVLETLIKLGRPLPQETGHRQGEKITVRVAVEAQ